MYMKNMNVIKFFNTVPKWKWSELLYGLENKLVNNVDIKEYTNIVVGSSKSIENVDLIIKLIICDNEECYDIVKMLSINEENDDDINLKKWIFSIIYYYYLYDKDVVFVVIEKLYSDFNYPLLLKSLVGYMPYTGEKSMIERLNDYIDENKKRWITKK